MYHVGCARIDITPPVGVDLSGYVAREQPSVGVLDPLCVRALVVQEDIERLLWLHCDLIGFDTAWATRVRQQLAGELELPAHRILLTATHTHSGPATVTLRQCGNAQPDYVDRLPSRFLAAAQQAANNLAPARLLYAETACDLGQDRRAASPQAHVDHRLPVLVFQRIRDDAALCVIANYAMHNVGLSAENRLISADMAGSAAARVRLAIEGEPIVMVTNGACGNVNPPSLSADPTVMRSQGERLAEAILSGARDAEEVEGSGLAIHEQYLSLPLTTMDRETVGNEFAVEIARQPAMARWRLAMEEWRQAALKSVENGTDTTETIHLTALRLGPVTFAGIGAEVFSRMGDDLRRRCGPMTYVLGYADGDIGYLPYRAIYEEGGYEAATAFKFYTSFMLAPGAYESVRENMISLVGKLGSP